MYPRSCGAFLAAFCSIHSEGEDAVYYAKKRTDGKRHNAAVICLANRKTRALFHMLTGLLHDLVTGWSGRLIGGGFDNGFELDRRQAAEGCLTAAAMVGPCPWHLNTAK